MGQNYMKIQKKLRSFLNEFGSELKQEFERLSLTNLRTRSLVSHSFNVSMIIFTYVQYMNLSHYPKAMSLMNLTDNASQLVKSALDLFLLF